MEAWANTIVGFIIAMIAQYAIMHAYGMPITLEQDFQIAVIFTVLSLLRSYFLRRVFNTLQQKERK